ncbi:hypothetical protein FLACHUCJ7_03184 [Flavobacterium chungangense]|uniref:Uncharacterized protein n=1 Tax=Flavobacterium chungangense TaxID=554283 RepID=A0A6V6Z5P6_9FLAO|nr:hypothetical protein FLACHUCJ7_03184 [Flavobacterium chungangense]
MLKKIFTKYLFFLLILLFGFGFILAYLFGYEQSYGINKTVGWAYDISNQVFFTSLIFTLSQILFIIGYLILFLIRRKTNYYLSIAHFEIIILTLVFSENFIVNAIFSVLSMILFFTNAFKSHK